MDISFKETQQRILKESGKNLSSLCSDKIKIGLANNVMLIPNLS
jgi:hypothetical protein